MKNKKYNKVNNDIESCNHIELGDLSRTQPHGVWLELDSKMRIVQYSENAPKFLETPLDDLLNHPILNFLKSERSEDNVSLWLTMSFSQYKPAIWSGPQKQIPILIFIHQEQGVTSLEIERNIEPTFQGNISPYSNEQIMAAMKKTFRSKTIDELANLSCKEIKKLTDYHRVIIYKFDPVDYTGIVVGEAYDEEMSSYIGLRFPSTDIPEPVREMYKKLPLRLRYIPSILENPVKIVSKEAKKTQEVSNLDHANLRMVAPVHAQYMKNMSICSASSVAIMQGDTLWGLIACHHREPKYLSQTHRYILDLFANIFSAQALAIESIQNFHDEEQIGAIHTELIEIFMHSKSLTEALADHNKDLMQMISSTGMSVYLQKEVLNYGETPEEKEILELISWLDKKNILLSYYTESLPLKYKPAFGFKHKSCGIFVIKIALLENHYVLFYKPERINTIAWAGDPKEVIQKDGKTYSPRASFDRYVENIENHSSPWTQHDIKSAELIHSLITTKQLQDILQKQAMYDPLTQLLNRLYLEQTLNQEIQRASRGEYPLVILLADLDHFKNINDNFGHPAGDEMLQSFARLIKKEFRAYDYIYRYGGEEFLIILPNTTLDAARKKANHLLLKTKNMQVRFNERLLPSITVSIGISTFPEHGNDARTIIAKADAALYQAKNQGRDRAVIAEGGAL